MNIVTSFALSLALAVGLGGAAARAQVGMQQTMAPTASGYAYANIKKADRSVGVLHIEVEFITDMQGYSGELIYGPIPATDLDSTIYLQAGDAHLPLIRVDGVANIHDTMQLAFNYNPNRNPRVGRWQGDFIAPEGAAPVYLILPNVAPIGPITIRDR
ncbi:hypothetical protein [Ketogulonicigenium vulgare]|uniref:Uncharacterized protein n=1 Tax=Ketogulonicigenium vulgare (strain WSH-001) TaxID=759362 RepID=F9Y4R4_KETVW|nr:hypothetical protein [Ketogulonicigenium vulgare]ADO42421.1 hypothetical protein EIO_1279 [Ketogulonicigenium vulgare Y25]AEM40621.1 hypothetical protein KVU_0782 [Ketogulonicigenium vulgare WSH-001]ALJ80794.1 hypothetical protein KVH_06150 [Ketogulonicigenium vulgare]ANW33576.1 hypothetical protein KvSKV_06120 [Ketogulonicigenium vulgare]AOZ54333.1 hypothetical protein KVC_1316 [Ketogulonicigenium vulgare]